MFKWMISFTLVFLALITETVFANTLDFDILAKEARRHNLSKQPEQAIQLLEPYRDHPENVSFLFFNNLGMAYKSTGEFEKAEWAFLRAIKVSKNRPTSYFNLGLTYFNMAKGEKEEFRKNDTSVLQKALIYLRKAAERDPARKKIKNVDSWMDYISNEIDQLAQIDDKPAFQTHY